MGTMERDRLFLKPDAFYAEAKCELMLGVAATSIDRAAKTVHARPMAERLPTTSC